MTNRRIMAGALATMGALHFVVPKPFESIIPPQLPGSAWLYNWVSGAWELATAALLARADTAALGGVSAAALFVAVWPANIYHAALEWADKPRSRVYHVLRQPAQVWLISQALKIAGHR